MKKNLFIVITVINILIIVILEYFLMQQRADFAESKKQIDMCKKEKAIMRLENKKLEVELRSEILKGALMKSQNKNEK